MFLYIMLSLMLFKNIRVTYVHFEFELELPLNLNFQPDNLKIHPLEQVLKQAQLGLITVY